MKKCLSLFAAILSLGLVFGTARAESRRKEWRENHPRRAQVNKRLHNQNRRIRQGVKNRTLTKDEAKQLRAEDKDIRQQERGMAKMNGGHITKQEQRTLNQEENKVSKQIYEEKHDGQTTTPPQPAPNPAQ